jgi:YbbR domain-containing protein
MKRPLFNDLGLKTVAVILAFALWLYVGTNQVLERRVDLKVVFTDLPADSVLSTDVQSSLTVLLVGRKERVGSIETRDLKALVSLQGVPVPSRDYPVKVQIANIPKGVAADVPAFLVTLDAAPVATPKPVKKPVRSPFRKR